MSNTTLDPVCGMTVDESSPITSTYQGRTFHFCSQGCRSAFEKQPDKYANQKPEPAPANEKRREKDRGTSLGDYLPLMVIVGLAALEAAALQAAPHHLKGGGQWMHDFMGLFMISFSSFKFFNMEGFADGFQMYDLLAKPVRAYAYVYPFIELGLGLGYLSHAWPGFVYGATIVVMLFGSLGVLNALRKGLDLNCACMGTVLKVPLSTVALVEDLGMAAMATVMLAVGGGK